ncbi:MAG TPA: metallopeptidase family protein [Bdellovibrionota bacterium]|nr:metallopeptidase family protein [Bdellovibrionota bacterium]
MTSARERDEFDRIFEEVFDGLPDDVAELLEEVPVIVEDEPSREVLAEFGIKARPGEADLCGLHAGLPLPDRSVFEPSTGPTRICLFRGPILRLADGRPRALARQIRITLLHEIGHLFGFSEERLRDLGYD